MRSHLTFQTHPRKICSGFVYELRWGRIALPLGMGAIDIPCLRRLEQPNFVLKIT